MNIIMENPKYILRFFFDYNCGGCLWSGNDAAYEDYGYGPLDGETYGLCGEISEKCRIELPAHIQERVLDLDALYSESLNWDDPGGDSMWDENQWNDFYAQARILCSEIARILGSNFNIIYEVE